MPCEVKYLPNQLVIIRPRGCDHLLFVFLDVSNIEVKYRRIEEENTRLLEDLKSAQSQSRRNREKINLDFEDNENRLRQSERNLRDIENRLNDSQSENDRLHDKIQGNRMFHYRLAPFNFADFSLTLLGGIWIEQSVLLELGRSSLCTASYKCQEYPIQLTDLQNNNNSIDDELNRKYEEVNHLREENDELIEEVERLREDLDRAQQEREKHRRRKYNVFEVTN